MKKVGAIIFIGIFVLGGWFGYTRYEKQKQFVMITSFADCAKLYPVMESYPQRCMTPDGRSFVQNIGNEVEFIDEILIDNPRPNTVIITPVTVSGKARGLWFFEGSFSGELIDANGKLLGSVILQAEDSGMTNDFVPFRGVLIFQQPETDTGLLRISNANASGLPENDKEVLIPIAF